MKLLFIGNFLKSDIGISSVSQRLAETLLVKGHVIHSASTKLNRIIRLIDMINTTLMTTKQVDAAIVDVFSGNAFLWAEIIGNLLFLLKMPFILILRGGDLPRYAAQHPERITNLFNKASIIVAPSTYLRKQMTYYREDIVIIPNPLSVDHYMFKKCCQPHAKLIWLRSFHQIYNPMLAIKVAVQLAHDHPELTLTMVGADKGDGSLQDTEKLVIRLGLEKRISFPGAVSKSQVPHWLQKGDIFLNTTNIDNTPVSVMEAMACGLCIVSTKVGGIPYLLEDGIDALLVPPDDPEAMASAVRRILTEPGLAEKLSINARKKVEQFDWSVILPQWEVLFEGLISQ